MAIYLQNSLTKKKEEFIPLQPHDVKMYACGVTVYDDCHVGHARSLFIFDCLKRYLEHRGYKVCLVRNITDVDDKIINRAKQEGAPFEEIRQRYIKNYYRDLAALEIEKADFEPLATENIRYMIDRIKHLLDQGMAYEVGGNVYFSVRSFPGYGQLSGQSTEEMLTAVRIEKDECKRDPLDFALWKQSKDEKPSWVSPWGPGRPGWHIECSVMSMRYLKTETLDIHAGGRDLIFPHHENEIAQSEALTGKRFAKYWIHHGLLTIEGRKMSKSLGNFVTVQEALAKYPPDVLKLFFLGAHYRSPADFSFSGLEKTKKGYEKIAEFLERAAVAEKHASGACPRNVSTPHPELEATRRRFEEAMDDDFNTAKASALLFGLVSSGNKCLAGDGGLQPARQMAGLLVELAGILGLRLNPLRKIMDVSLTERVKVADVSAATLDRAEVERLVAERREARKIKNYRRADEIRAYLGQHGIVLEDTEPLS